MSRNARKIVAIVLLLAFAGWIIMTVLPKGGGTSSNGGGSAPIEEYEPQFVKEGDLWLLSPEGDTLRQLQIELAESAEEIEYGMMYRKSMDPNTGMLFLMGDERPRSFWMKNTYVPLDIIYINSANEVVSIQKNAEPLKTRSLPSEGPATYVLEVVGGFSDQYGIDNTTKIAWRRDQ